MIQYDLIVVGGGISGMTAALSALENGVKNVIIIEKEIKLNFYYIESIWIGWNISMVMKFQVMLKLVKDSILDT